MTALPGSPQPVHDPRAPSAEMQVHRDAFRGRTRALANWDPSYPTERVNFYKEYVQRHAPITMSWFPWARDGFNEEKELREATGMGILYDDSGEIADKLVAPLDDGSIAIWDSTPMRDRDKNTRYGRLIDRTAMGLLVDRGTTMDWGKRLARSKASMTETGAVECVSIDSRQKKGYFAVQNVLNEVDLSTLQVVSREIYPFAITALSEAKHPTPLTVGTNWSLHLHDPRRRLPDTNAGHGASTRCELIAGTPPKGDFYRSYTGDRGKAHAPLSQPGPLSILHLPDRDWDGDGDIWVAGRFTSLLNYDRRFFPRLRGTVHSGARISSIARLPHPLVPRELDPTRRPSLSAADARAARSAAGNTIIAAGEYKGKGSLELYGVPAAPTPAAPAADPRAAQSGRARGAVRNRQTASRTKLLGARPHGTRLVYADGDGNVKWVERDGFTPVRQHNINAAAPAGGPGGLFAAPAPAPGESDIVQKMAPAVADGAGRADALGRDDLLVWTGDGRLGVLGFGRQPGFDADGFKERARAAEEAERGREERAYGSTMRRALERQADEVRFMRGLGLGV